MLRWRVLTALVLLPLVLGAVFLLPTPLFAVAMAVVVALAGWEWSAMTGVGSDRDRSLHVAALVLFGTIFGIAIHLNDRIGLFLATAVAVWLGLAAWLIRYELGRSGAAAVRGVPAAVLGVALLIPAWHALVWIHGQPGGAWLLVAVFVLTWASDVGAYFAGRLFGRRKLAPRTSPGKTVEGAVGGLGVTLVAAWVLAVVLPVSLPGGVSLWVLACVTFAASVLGDLLESMIKRRCGVKDSGTLLPGHGGVLDRIDSLTATAPVFAAGLLWL